MWNIFAMPMIGILAVVLTHCQSLAEEKQVDGLPAITQFEAILLKDYDTGRIYNSIIMTGFCQRHHLQKLIYRLTLSFQFHSIFCQPMV